MFPIPRTLKLHKRVLGVLQLGTWAAFSPRHQQPSLVVTPRIRLTGGSCCVTVPDIAVPTLSANTSADLIPLPPCYRSQRKPAPSPLHASTAISPPSSASPSRSNFPSSPYRPQPSHTPPHIDTDAHPADQPSSAKTYFDSDSSGAASPEATSPGYVVFFSSSRKLIVPHGRANPSY